MSQNIAPTAFGNITSANSTAVLTVAGLFPSGLTLQQYATDQSITMDEVTSAETRMGVDGFMAAGWVPSIKSITIMLEASSPSAVALGQLFRAQEQARNPLECTLTVRVPAIGKTYTYSGGVLKTGTPFPSHKKVLEPTTWKFDFGKFAESTL